MPRMDTFALNTRTRWGWRYYLDRPNTSRIPWLLIYRREEIRIWPRDQNLFALPFSIPFLASFQNSLSKMTTIQDVPEGTVVIAGGGPVGLILARVLSFYGVKSKLFERNETTTSWPKMDLTNARSMELFRKLGLADDLRKHGAPSHFDQHVLISTGLSSGAPITRWDLPGVDKFRKQILKTNDGTQPLEPWQRLSQAIFEKWLKGVCDKDPLIDLNYGFRVDGVEEDGKRVKIIVSNSQSGASTTWRCGYVAGCDGASSQVRRSLNLPLEGGPM